MSYKILKVIPDSKESENHIVDAYLVLRRGKTLFEVFVPNWMEYFPYRPKPSKWGVGQQLIDNLLGKDVDAELKFVDLKKLEKNSARVKNIQQENNSSNNTIINGEVVRKEKSASDNSNYENLIIDCGLHLISSAEKGKFKAGDFVTGQGVLNAYLKSIGGEKLRNFL